MRVFWEKHKNGFAQWLVPVVIITIMFLFYVLNYYTPLYADDYSYSISFANYEKIKSIAQVSESQIAHYFSTNGRSVTHTFAQIFLLMGDGMFNYINTVAFIVLIFLIYIHIYGTARKFKIGAFSSIAMLIFLSSPGFGQSFLWITGAANYMYGIMIVLIALLPYRIQACSLENKKRNFIVEILGAIVGLVVGIIAGWTNENTAVAMIVMMLAYIISFIIKRVRLHIWNFSGVIGAIGGCIMMLASPGNAVRLETTGGTGGIISWIKRAIFYTCDIVVNLQLILIIFGVLICLCVIRYSGPFKLKKLKEYFEDMKKYSVPIVYLLGFLASVYSMIVSPSFPARAWSGPVVMALILLGTFSANLNWVNKSMKVGRNCIVLFVTVLFFATYMNSVFELKNVNHEYQNRVAMIEQAISEGEEIVEIPNIYGYSGYCCYGPSGDLDPDNSKWPNTAIARYYGIKKIIRND